MSNLSLGGVLSGIDYSALVQAEMEMHYTPLNQADRKKSQYESMNKAIAELERRFTQFQDLASSLSDATNVRRAFGSSADSDIVTVSAGSGASPGSHTVEVNQLAKAQRFVNTAGLTYLTQKVGANGDYASALNTNDVANADATWFTTGADGAVYTFQFGEEEEIEVTLEANTAYTMNEVVSLINAASQSAGSYDAASVYDNGSSFQLEMTAKHRGEQGVAMTVTLDSGTAIDELDDAGADWTNTDGTDVDTGAFVYTYNGVTRTITTGADTTLNDLVEMINQDGSNPGVTASVIQHDGAYHLVLSGQHTGSDYTITIDDALTTIPGFDTADFTETQAAQNAQYKVDGYPTGVGDWMESASNSISDVIPGATLSITGTGSTTVTLNRTTEKFQTDVANLVEIYNGMVDTIDLYCGYDEETKTGGILQGDGTIANLLGPMRDAITQILPGFTTSGDTIAMGADVGIEIDSTGHLELDTDKLADALDSNYDEVVNFFSANGRGVTDSSLLQFSSALSTTKAGSYEVKVEFDGTGTITGAWIRTEGEGDGDWRIADYDTSTNTITGKTGNDEAGLEMTVTWDGVSTTQTNGVRLQQGLCGVLEDLADNILDSTSGTLAVRESSYDTTIEELDRRIETLEERLLARQEALEAKYARMEAALAQLDSYSGSFNALFASLDANKSNSQSSSQ